MRFVKEAGAEAVKIEGPRVELVRALTEAEIPVVGHLGLTPQSVHRMGGYRVQARTADAVRRLQADAHALADAGAGALVLEGVPREAAAAHHRRAADSHHRHWRGPGLRRPDSGLPRSGQSDLRACRPNLSAATRDAAALIRAAIEHYREDVEHRAFPSDEESYHLPRRGRGQALRSQADDRGRGRESRRLQDWAN